MRGSTVSPSEGRGASGRLFKQASIWVSTVANSSNLSLVSPITRFKCDFIALTVNSHNPPKWGVCYGMNFQVIFCMAQNFEVTPWVFQLWKKVMNSLSSFTAPTKLVPWSLHNSEGLSLRTMNRRKVAMKASVEKSEVNSRCTALTETQRHTRMLWQMTAYESIHTLVWTVHNSLLQLNRIRSLG